MPVITAIFEKGIFRPLGPVELAEGSQVQVEIPAPTKDAAPSERTPEEEAHIDRIYEILSRRYDGGEKDVAARHNENQP
jgi:predicted DNA-binding antitoxin AbrB/MazE fold protein